MTNNRYWTIGLGVLTAISIGVCVYLYLRVDHLNSRLETLGDNVIYYCDSIDQVQFQVHEFKEQSYIRQQEHDTNLILLVFGLLFTAFAALNLVISEARLTSFKEKISEDTTQKTSKWNKKHKHLKRTLESLQADVKSEVAWLKKEDAKDALEAGDRSGYIFFTFIACKLFTEAALYYKGNAHEEMVKTFEGSIENTLSTALDKINNQSIQMADHDSEDFLSLFNDIRKLGNYKIDKLISQIQPFLIFSP